MNCQIILILALCSLTSVVPSLVEKLPGNIRIYQVSRRRPIVPTPEVITERYIRPSTVPPIPVRLDQSFLSGISEYITPVEPISPIVLPRRPANDLSKITTGDVLENGRFTCNGHREGHYADVQYNCEFFHNCHFYQKENGQWYVQDAVFQCGEGTRFNQTTRTCDHKHKVICDQNVIDEIIRLQYAEPTPIPGYAKPLVFPKTSFRCDYVTRKQGYFYADVEAGCTVFHRCTYHEEQGVIYATQYSFHCPAKTLFDQEKITCNHANEVDCRSSPLYEDAQAALH